MSAHDRHLAGFSSSVVEVTCTDCGHRWDDAYESEYGRGELVDHPSCPKCRGTMLDVVDLDATDIRERQLEARGIDF